MTRTTDNSYHFTKDPSATGSDALQVDSRQTEERVKGSLTETDASLAAQPQTMRGDNSTNTKRTPRRKPTHRKWWTTYDCYTPTQQERQKAAFTFAYDNFWKFCFTGQRRYTERPVWKWTAPHYCSSTSSPLDESAAPDYRIQIANGNIVPVRKQVLLRFSWQDKILRNNSCYYQRWATYSLECLFSNKTSLQ